MERLDERFYSRLVRALCLYVCDIFIYSLCSLTVDPVFRPPPKEMLKHPWIVKSEMERVNMKELVRDIWGWEKSKKKKRDGVRRMASIDVASGEDDGKDGEFD